jgi:hypothetical protein
MAPPLLILLLLSHLGHVTALARSPMSLSHAKSPQQRAFAPRRSTTPQQLAAPPSTMPRWRRALPQGGDELE